MRDHCPQRRRQGGITLLELMTVLVIVSILTAIAVPSYRRYSVRAQRTEAKTALLQLATNEERFYLQNNAYTLNPTAIGFAGNVSENGVYTLAIATVGGVTQDFTATATPTAGGGTNGVDMTTDGECASFTITSSGVRSAAPDPNGKCW